jgi:uncharacterized protein
MAIHSARPGRGDDVPTTHDGPLETLDDAECRRLLATAGVGRLGFTDRAMPAIVPVSFVLHENSLLIPAHRDSILRHALRGAVVALGVDSYRDVGGPGWSVTVVGPSRSLTDPRDVARLDRLTLFPPPVAATRCYITVQARLVRGWRTAATASAPD